jgi:hypothetical protein
MRQSAADILQRWMKLDARLNDKSIGGGLNPAKFALACGVDLKTIRRDLAVFKDLGYVPIQQQWEGDKMYHYQYQIGQRPMFTMNMKFKESPK